MRMFIGIDPGVSGGIAAVDEQGRLVEYARMPDTDHDLWSVIAHFGGATRKHWTRRAVIERVNAGVFGMGKAGRMGVVSAMTFGKNVGKLQAFLTAASIPYEEISPVQWQRAMGCLSKGNKNITKARAQQLFPQVKVTHAIADALLIAEFARRLEVRSHVNGGQHGEAQSSETAQG